MSPIHRMAQRTTLTVVALVASAVLAACATSPDPTPGGPTPTVRPMPGVSANKDSQPSLVMIIRHGEKPDGSSPGVDPDGKPDDKSLTAVGWNRAHHLVDLLAPTQGPPRRGLAKPTAIYAAGANDNGEGERTRETVQPLAQKLGITVNTDFGKGNENSSFAVCWPVVTGVRAGGWGLHRGRTCGRCPVRGFPSWARRMWAVPPRCS